MENQAELDPEAEKSWDVFKVVLNVSLAKPDTQPCVSEIAPLLTWQYHHACLLSWLFEMTALLELR